MLARIRKATEDKDQGFTLIELLVVIVIIGILAAIAIPTFLNQREKAWARAAQSDLRNAATVMEQNFGETGTYAGYDATKFKKSDDASAITIKTATATTYCLDFTSAKLQGTDLTKDDSKFWKFDSAAGKAAPGKCA